MKKYSAKRSLGTRKNKCKYATCGGHSRPSRYFYEWKRNDEAKSDWRAGAQWPQKPRRRYRRRSSIAGHVQHINRIGFLIYIQHSTSNKRVSIFHARHNFQLVPWPHPVTPLIERRNGNRSAVESINPMHLLASGQRRICSSLGQLMPYDSSNFIERTRTLRIRN